MAEELSTGIALCTAWESGDTKSWAQIARESLDNDAVDVLGQVTHIAVQLARALASVQGELEAKDIFNHLALDGLNDDGTLGP